MLLIPEGALVLNPPAAATLELVNGERSVTEIVDAIVSRFEVDGERAAADVAELLDRLAARGFVVA